MKAKEVLSLLKISQSTLNKYAKNGQIKYKQDKNKKRDYDRDSVYDFYHKNCNREKRVYLSHKEKFELFYSLYTVINAENNPANLINSIINLVNEAYGINYYQMNDYQYYTNSSSYDSNQYYTNSSSYDSNQYYTNSPSYDSNQNNINSLSYDSNQNNINSPSYDSNQNNINSPSYDSNQNNINSPSYDSNQNNINSPSYDSNQNNINNPSYDDYHNSSQLEDNEFHKIEEDKKNSEKKKVYHIFRRQEN